MVTLGYETGWGRSERSKEHILVTARSPTSIMMTKKETPLKKAARVEKMTLFR